MPLSQRRSQLLGRLRHRKTRVREGLVLVEGVRAVGEALAAGADAKFACVSPRLDEWGREGTEDRRGAGRLLRGALDEARVEVVDLPDVELADLADTDHPQGVLLVCREPRGDASVLAPRGRYLVLDALQDPGNVGTLIRAAVAFDLDAVVVLDGTADPWSPKAVRASAGMIFRIPLLSLDAGQAMDRLTEGHVDLLVAVVGGSDVALSAPTDGWALAVGNEGAGVRDELRAGAQRDVGIRMPGPAESLNAGVAGAILLYVLTREGSLA